MTDDWTTRVEPGFTALYGLAEVHSVQFLPKDWPGEGPEFTLLIPECEMQLVQFVILDPTGAPITFVNRPKINKNIKYWTRFVCKETSEKSAAVHFACDTAEQAARAARLAEWLLPNHERVELERMYSANTRVENRLELRFAEIAATAL